MAAVSVCSRLWRQRRTTHHAMRKLTASPSNIRFKTTDRRDQCNAITWTATTESAFNCILFCFDYLKSRVIVHIYEYDGIQVTSQAPQDPSGGRPTWPSTEGWDGKPSITVCSAFFLAKPRNETKRCEHFSNFRNVEVNFCMWYW